MQSRELSFNNGVFRILQITDNDCHDVYSQKGLNRYQIITNKQNTDLGHLVDYIYKV